MVRRPARSATYPAVRTKAARVRTNASSTHCISENEPPRARRTSGRATLTPMKSISIMSVARLMAMREPQR